jgi:antibiotic biosynthesis monooxygenase (ABM) superfamily enzyme
MTTRTNLPRLTGPYSTQQLKAITDDPVTITVEWTPVPGLEEQFRSALDALAHGCQGAEGSLGVALLEPGQNGGEYHLLARFSSATKLRNWEESQERRVLLEQLHPYVGEFTVAATHSPEAFFAAMVGTSSAPVHHRWILDVAWFLPASLLVSWLVSPYTGGLPLIVRVVIGSATVSLLYALTLGPVRKLIAHYQNRRAPLR